MELFGLEVGDWATWVGAFGTIAAFMAVIYQMVHEKHLRRYAELTNVQNELRAQASQVSCWYDLGSGSSVVISNQSSQPIYDVAVALLKFDDPMMPQSIEALISDGNITGHLLSRIHVVPPGKYLLEVMNHPNWKDHPYFSVDFAFTDSAGNSWLRRKNGDLVQLPAKPDEHLFRRKYDYLYRTLTPHVL